jgi:hypothetical protein
LARVYEGIDPIDDILSAAETQHSEALAAKALRHSLREGGEKESREKHDDCEVDSLEDAEME